MFPTQDHLDHTRRWQTLLDARRYPNRNPPAPPAVATNRDATDALFRGFAADRRRLAWQVRS